MGEKNRSEYFKERRKKYANFSCEADKEKLALFDELLKKKGYTKKDWLDMKIDEALNQ